MATGNFIPMTLLAPLPQATQRAGTSSNAYQGRWRWWYTAIADEMLKNPTVTQKEIAANIGRSPTTINAIVNTDLFKEYFAQRKAEWTRQHDDAIRKKLLGVTEASLDTLLTQINTKKDQIPIGMVKDIAMDALEKLGYGLPTGPQVVVNNNTDARQQTVALTPASLAELETARSALRVAEARRAEVPTLPSSEPAGAVLDGETIVEELMEDRQGASSE